MQIRHLFLAMIIVCLATAVYAAKPEPVCDADGDNFLSDHRKCGGGDCDDTDPDVNPGATEICDGIDNDCDGTIDEDCPEPPPAPTQCDKDADGYEADSKKCKGDDCNDNNPAVNPGATEICDGIDNDCDGSIDNGLPAQTYYEDWDFDNFGNPYVSQVQCFQPSGFVLNDTDCDDTSSAVNPDATEICDETDNNCDGTVDEGCSSIYPVSMAAAGDSITVAYNADGTSNLFGGQTYEQYELTWALGDDTRVYSLAQRLFELNPAFSWNAVTDNYAVSGANIIDLQDQVRQIVQNGPYDFVAIFIGHNDICDASTPSGMLDVGTFNDRFTTAMEILYSQEDPPDVVVSSLAKISDLYDVGRNDSWCRLIWSLGSICRVVTSGDPDNIAQADQRTQDYNEVLESHAAEYGYTYVPQTYGAQFSLDDLSAFDCFHPNDVGQNRIADIIWNNGLYSH